MNWIKDHKFYVGLGGVTLVIAIVLWVFGAGAANRYEAAKEQYDNAHSEGQRFEKLELYPVKANLEAKKVALGEYREAVESLQQDFSQFRVESLEKLSPQAFSDALKRAHQETMAAFGDRTAVPETYYCGFEDYKTSLASGNATPILNYQLAAVKRMMLDLAESGASSLVNIHRPHLKEEQGKESDGAGGVWFWSGSATLRTNTRTPSGWSVT